MEFGLLGPLLVCDGEDVRPVPAAKHRIVLAALLLRAGEIVPAGELAEAVWDDPPPGARATLQTYVMRLRNALGAQAAARIESRPPGYRIEVSRSEFDLHRFTDLQDAAQAAAAGRQWQQAADGLRTALALWRGQPLVDVPSTALHRDHAHRLAELRLAALQSRVDADLNLGLAQRTVPELLKLTREHPLREAFHSRLMLALYRTGRQAEALDVFIRARRTLIAGLGVEPGTELRRMHRRILAGDPTLLATDRPTLQLLPPPFQLPADTLDFTGRDTQAAELTGYVREHTDAGVPVVVLSGQAGVGKTCLAVHAAHRLRSDFPDGILFADLMGFGRRPVAPAAALDRFLRALGVTACPQDEDERSALLRSLLAGKRVLLVLDNATDAAQVRPLLPGSPGSAALVTSRNRLAGPAGARLVELDVLPAEEALALLTRSIGSDRVDADPAGAETVVRACGRLPLAVRIAGARLASRPHWSVRDLAERLAERRRTLDELRIADLDVRVSIALSHANLSRHQAGALRALSVLEAPDFGLDCASALLGTVSAATDRTLEELLDMNLLTEVGPGRYGMHDLLRAFLQEQPEDTEARTERIAGLHALLDHLIERTQSLMGPLLLRAPDVPLPPPPGTTPTPREWLGVEHRTIVEAVEQVGTEPLLPARLAATLTELMIRALVLVGAWDDLRRCGESTLAAALRDDDAHSEGIARSTLALVEIQRRQLDAAEAHLARAAELAAGEHDRAGEATIRLYQGTLWGARANTGAAIAGFTAALDIFTELSMNRGIVAASSYLGEQCTLAGDPKAALVHLGRALTLARSGGDADLESMSLQKLSAAHSAIGNHEDAISLATHGLQLCRERRSLHSQSIALAHLGDCLANAGRNDEAGKRLEEAVALCDAVGDRHRADQARARLSQLPC